MTSVESNSDPSLEQLSPTAHELSSYWTLWTHVAATASVGGKKKRALGPLFDFNSVENFWVVYNSLRQPVEMTGRLDIIFMRSQLNADIDDLPDSEAEQHKFSRVQPEWEDANNIGGGEFRFCLSSDPEIASKQWELTLLAVLGGSLPLSEEICGVWLAIGRKHGTTLALWQRTPDDETPPDVTEQLAKAWAQLLDGAQTPLTEITYTTHKDALVASLPGAPPAVKITWAHQELVGEGDTL